MFSSTHLARRLFVGGRAGKWNQLPNIQHRPFHKSGLHRLGEQRQRGQHFEADPEVELPGPKAQSKKESESLSAEDFSTLLFLALVVSLPLSIGLDYTNSKPERKSLKPDIPKYASSKKMNKVSTGSSPPCSILFFD